MTIRNVQPTGASVFFLDGKTRVPLKFGREVVTSITCARVLLTIRDQRGNCANGWGETPLGVQWGWPGSLSYEERLSAMQDLCRMLVKAWAQFPAEGHALELGHAFLDSELPRLLEEANRGKEIEKQMPWLAALICCSAFDIALHDAYGNLHGVPVYQTYTAEYMNHDLNHYLEPAPGGSISFAGLYPGDFLRTEPSSKLIAWHLVGGKDALQESELVSEVSDGYPLVLTDWVERDGLKCLKIKLTGTDSCWDYQRLVDVGRIAWDKGVLWLSTDFNCTVTDPAYVVDILNRLRNEHPRIYAIVLYVEQPFPYDLEEHAIDVHEVSCLKPLFMDESAHDWTYIRMGRALGWNGVALKTCKTQTGALLSFCWAKAHGMSIMVQDLTNPMLAQVPHVLLAAHTDTIMGVETNSMQFIPEASHAEAQVHPGLYQRTQGELDLSSLQGSGFGYRVQEMKRVLPPGAAIYP